MRNADKKLLWSAVKINGSLVLLWEAVLFTVCFGMWPPTDLVWWPIVGVVFGTLVGWGAAALSDAYRRGHTWRCALPRATYEQMLLLPKAGFVCSTLTPIGIQRAITRYWDCQRIEELGRYPRGEKEHREYTQLLFAFLNRMPDVDQLAVPFYDPTGAIRLWPGTEPLPPFIASNAMAITPRPPVEYTRLTSPSETLGTPSRNHPQPTLWLTAAELAEIADAYVTWHQRTGGTFYEFSRTELHNDRVRAQLERGWQCSNSARS